MGVNAVGTNACCEAEEAIARLSTHAEAKITQARTNLSKCWKELWKASSTR